LDEEPIVKALLISVVIFMFVVQPSGCSITEGSLEYLLSQRVSIRNWSSDLIEDEIVETILKNSFASAFDLKGMELYMANSSGNYWFNKESNLIIFRSSEDVRYELGSDVEQTFVANAPCVLTLTWNETVEHDPLNASKKAGIIVQNLYILTVRYNLGGVCVGDRIYVPEVTENIQNHLSLPPTLKPILLFPIGYLPTGQSYPTGDLQPTLGNLLPPLESGIDVLELFHKVRQSVSIWENVSVPQQKLSNILWATYGYSLLGTWHRTVPSAYGEYPFQIYVYNETGVYNYTAETHSIYQTSFVDKRSDVIKHANASEYLEKASTLLVFCWNNQAGAHNASDADSGGRFINIGYGCCLQNLYLSAKALNLSISPPFYTDNYDALRADLSDSPLPNIYPMYVTGLGETYEDVDPPLIGTPFRTANDEVLPSQEVKVSVRVNDTKSGVKNVTLSYTTDNGTSWTDIPMNYSTTIGFYEAIIPKKPAGTLVKYEIVAFDRQNNKSVENNSRQYYVYTVIPEFMAIMFLLILLFSTVVIFVVKKSTYRPALKEHAHKEDKSSN